MEVYNEIINKRKMIVSDQITLKQNFKRLDINTSENNLDKASRNHDKAAISKINVSDSIRFYSSKNSRENPVCTTKSLLTAKLENHQSIIADRSNLSKIDMEIDTKKKIISSMLNILRNHAAEAHFSSGRGIKNIVYFYTLFQDCISNFLIEGFGGLVIDSLIDILLPANNFFFDMELEYDLQNYNVIPSILYYYLVGMTPNNTFLSEKPFLNMNFGERASSFLLPISRAVSEVDYAWLTKQNFPDGSEELSNESKSSKLENLKEITSIFSEEQIPNLIVKIISCLKNMYLIAKGNSAIEEHSIAYLFKENPMICDDNQTPFYIGRLLEICLSKCQKEFTSIFLQLDGPLVIIPFIYYSSIQDFFLRFFGFIGNNSQREFKYGEYSSSILEFEHLESNQESLMGEFETTKPHIQEQLLEVGISHMIYEWVIESEFIQNFVSPLFDIINYDKEDFIEESELGFRKTDIINIASGVIEVIFRLVEYLKPEHTGLPLNMTSIGLKWVRFASELNNPRNLYLQNDLNSNLNLLCEAEHEIPDLNKFFNIEYSVIEGDKLNNSSIQTSQKKFDEKNLEYENSGKRFNSNKILYSQVNFFEKNKDENRNFGTQIENCLPLLTNGNGRMVRNLTICQTFEKSKWFLNNLIIDSSMLNIVCELSIHNSNDTFNENIYLLKLRSLSTLEEIINLAFSTNINIIGCFKTKIINIIKPYLTRFCEFMISKFEIDTNKKETVYMVSLLTIIKIILLYDENHELINTLSTEFWVWLLDLLIKRRENSHISVQCKTIFELALKFGSCSTLENLFNNVKLVDKLSKFIYDGTDLDGNFIENKELVNRKTGKRIRRVLGSIYNLFMILGQHYDDFLKMIVPYNPYTCEVIKHVLFSQLNKYSKIDNETMEILGLVIKNEFEINYLSQNGEKFEFISSISMDPQKMSLLANLSCNTKFHEFVKGYQNQNKNICIERSFSTNEDLNSKFTKNIENSPRTPKSSKRKCTNLEDSSSTYEVEFSNSQSLSDMLKNYFSGSIVDLLKCDENCKCPKWSFCNVLSKLIIEKNYSGGISVFPILPLEESKKIRENRKRQMKLYSSAQKND
ncbi:uncharacterized protein ELE39_001944 [Cryptosporidium sp. chipmunk genotype I]|uniref:uncharacterized protein n=1 Tax=Cryptosporidium sp. chipmunk genotype I TaxID=1280935 RepID=UPI003519E459|nr:hypothetical protein ELE39_001944 [Cryptosporidium sp. chipmunk genotype I]